MRNLLYLLLGLWLACEIKAQSSCSSATTCNECYAIPNCAWCSDRSFTPTEGQPRCGTRGTLSSYCNMIDDAQSSTMLDERELNSDNQISINKATVNLRAGETETVSVSIRPAENFPLDLYFLLDLSFSLNDDLVTIKSISQDIVDAIRNISTRFQVGFGTYVDKLTMPYISNVQLRSGCGSNLCVVPFSYVHNINLTNNSVLFSDGFQNTNISTNADDPEGTFDAIFQAALCDSVVGWRPTARKIILVLTDDSTHTAGDGKLAGIVRPPPFECLTNYEESTGRITYTSNLLYDFPSVGQIRQALIENTIVPIFAVTEPNLKIYDDISDLLEGTNAATVPISGNSQDIIGVIQTAYERAVSNVALSFETQPDVTITYRATCPDIATANPDGLSCSDVVVNTTTIFDIDVKLERCPQQQNFTKTFTMRIPAYGTFEIEVNAVCSCDCHRSAVVNSTECSGNGLLSCGVCDCNMGWSGDRCDCNSEIEIACPLSGGLECRNRGTCDCGVCKCSQPNIMPFNNGTLYNVTHSSISEYAIVSGQPFVNGSACECDNFSCDRNQSQFVCSGSTNGDCVCTSTGPDCQCKTSEYGGFPYTGEACQCNVAYCYNPSMPYNNVTSLRCSGRGTCSNCNREQPCACRLGFTGRYCETATNPVRASCNGNNDCIRCIADNPNFQDACPCQSTASFRYTRLPADNESHMITNDNADSSTTQRCTFTTADPFCTYVYYIALPNIDAPGGSFVHVEPDGACFPLRWWHIALILLAVLILLGILILAIIKICFILADRAEWKKFEKEVAETDLSKNFNPLYHSPAVKYDNIAFGKE